MNALAPSADDLPRTAVLVQHAGIGDLVWHRPYFIEVARRSRDGQVDVIAPPSTLARELVAHEPWVRSVVDFDRRPRDRRRGKHSGLHGLFRMGKELQALRLDRIVLFTDHPGRALIACLRAGIPQRLGYGTNWLQRRLLTRSPWIALYEGPAAPAYKDATAFSIAQGWCDAPIVPRLVARPDALERMRAALAGLPRPIHALSIGASEPYKQWGERNFVELATLLARQGHGVVLNGGPDETPLAQSILAQMDADLRDRVRPLTQGSIADTVAAMSLVQACIGNDTGAAQIAAAMGTPTVVILGPRPTLEHDPATLHMLRAPRLEDIPPAEAAAAVLARLPS